MYLAGAYLGADQERYREKARALLEVAEKGGV